jgi:predicted metal-dependent hydrolase
LKALGERYRLHLAGGRRPGVVAVAPGVLALSGNWGATEPAVTRRAMLQWLLGYSRDALAPRLLELAQRGGFRFSALQVRRQRTRWGSCSSRGVISLNVCGVFQSPEVLQYLMIHELAHTRHMNHSAAYWRTVAEHLRRLATVGSRAQSRLAARSRRGFSPERPPARAPTPQSPPSSNASAAA